jgi:hypothetical protein
MMKYDSNVFFIDLSKRKDVIQRFEPLILIMC